jgi:hypothetical protein
MRRCFDRFARHLDARARTADPVADLAALGRAYRSDAAAHPLEYRLMFGTPWPDAAARDRADLDALQVWSAIHGVVGVMHGSCIDGIGLAARLRRQAMGHVMVRVGQSVAG